MGHDGAALTEGAAVQAEAQEEAQAAQAGSTGPADQAEARPPTPTEARALIVAQRRDYARRNTVRSAPLLLSWGLAWLVGYAVMALADGRASAQRATAYAVFVVCLVAAGIFTAAYVALRSRGVRGTSGRHGAFYGGAWMGGMALTGIILGRINSFLATVGTPEASAVGALVSSAVPCLVVGVIFLVGSALWDETAMGALGGWILAVTAVATVVGLPWAWWVMAVGGGGGMLLVAALGFLDARRTGSL